MSQTQEIQTTIQKALEYGSKFGNVAFQWEPYEKQLYLKDAFHFKRGMKLKLIIHCVFGALMVYETLTNSSLQGIAMKSQAWFTCAIVIMGGHIVWNTLNNHKILMGNINQLVKLEMELENDGNKLSRNEFIITTILCKQLLFAAKAVCFAFGLPAAFMPEFPTNLFLFANHFFSKDDHSSHFMAGNDICVDEHASLHADVSKESFCWPSSSNF
ncbi:unnamed protein product [Orchesella dallaii]|uniref:Uncharacterized protein n=1 Tax=Orchesella dallaii TaxID=48710 RepID=A0ABP1R5K6_9HEXA